MNKTVLIAFAIAIIITPCFAASNAREFFPGKRNASNSVYPVDNTIGTVSAHDKTPEHILVSELLESEFSFEWAEKYLHPDTKAALVKIVTPVFTEILPCKEFTLSNSTSNGDESISISAHLVKSGYVISFVLKDSKVYGISIKQN